MEKQLFGELLEIMSRLRGNGGCPWDRAQTIESIKPFLIEECYEVIEAIEEGNPQKIKEELGDLLFQIIFKYAGDSKRITIQKCYYKVIFIPCQLQSVILIDP